MIFGFSQQQALIDNDSMCWMFDVFAWAQKNFSRNVAENRAKLILPTNDFFPGKGASVEEMAALIFSQVKSYMGLSELACELQNETGSHQAVPSLPGSEKLPEAQANERLVLTYLTHTLNDPEVLIASFAHQLAFYLVTTAEEAPPGGRENWAHAAELLASFLGFGVIMANTANTQKIRSCGSCSGPAVERESFLSQYDMTYALTIYTSLNNVTVKEALSQLKKSLRSFYKKSNKQITNSQFAAQEKLKLLSSVS
jgi:hypothetical protein